MDRQTKIAFGLIFLVLIAYYAWLSYFSPKSEPAPVQTPVEQLDESQPEAAFPEGESAAAEIVRETAPPPPAMGEAVRRRLIVETPLARYRLDSRGALIREIDLLDFQGYDEEGKLAGRMILFGHRPDGSSSLALDLSLLRGSTSIETAELDFSIDLLTDSLYVESETVLVFRYADGQGGELLKTYTFFPDSYEFTLSLEGRLAGTFEGTDGYGLAWRDGILSTEKNRKDDVRSFNNFYRLGDHIEKKSLRNFKNNKPIYSEEGTVSWLASKNKYFVAALIPDGNVLGRAALLGDKNEEFLGYRAEFPLRGGQTGFRQAFHVYAGPIVRENLLAYENGLEGLQDLGKLIRPISVGIKWLMAWLYRWIPNYGVVIILMSVFTKVLFYRLSHKSFKSMKDMQSLQPELQKMKEKYGEDKQKINEETMKLYKEKGVNPLGGCLPLLLQMPVFFALFRVLRGAVELRGASFIWWMDDLSNMDIIYYLPFEIPMVGGFIENSLAVLPLLMGLSMWAQTKLGGSGMGAGPTQAGAQAAAMNKIMPIFMTVIFYRMPSGLVLYWLVNNILSVIQQYYIHKGEDDSGKVVPAAS